MTCDNTSENLLSHAVYAYLVDGGFAKAAKRLRKQLKLDKRAPLLRSHRLSLCEHKADVLKKADAEMNEEKAESPSPKREKGSSKKEPSKKDTENEKKAFQRVDPAKVEFLDDRCRDNSYEAVSARNGYGLKAHSVLAPTKGADFRKQKNKQKKGTYRCGPIDTACVNSIKFAYSDDDGQ